MERGDALLIPTPPNGRHLFVVVTEILQDKVLCVNITTARENSDRSCVIQEGEHPFIKHDSVASYRHAQLLSIEALNHDINNGEIIRKQPVSSELLARIIDGGKASSDLRRGYKRLLEL